MRSTALLSLLLLGAAFAGCVQPSTELDAASAQLALGEILASETGLWLDPQNAPHPAFGWPTLVHPAQTPPSEWWKPVPAAPELASIEGLEPVANVGGNVASVGGIAIFGSILVAPGNGEVSWTIDIRDPSAPKVLGEMEGYHRGAAIVAYPDGRLVAVMASGGTGIESWDITDPTQPELLSVVEENSHKLGVVPGTPIVYNSNQAIVDLTDPTKPEVLGQTGHSCHHIFFWNDASQSKFRALCAGYAETVIWDTTDPRAPTVVSMVPHFHGNRDLPPASVTPVTFSHTALYNDDGTILVVGDEVGGGALAACGAHAEAGGVSISTPTGALWFYDVSDETSPRLLGWFSPTSHLASNPTGFPPSCTAHHGRLVPDPEGRDLLVMAFYAAGVALVDFTDPANPMLVDQWNDGTGTWEAWHYEGWIFTGDLARGVDVLSLR